MSRFGNLEFSRSRIEQALRSGEVSDEAVHLREADAAFRRGAFEQALRFYARALERAPNDAAAWVGQARMLIEMGQFDEANRWADKALERFPRHADALAAKAVVLARRGDTKAALAFSDAALEEESSTPYAWLARGDVLLARAEKRSEHCFAKALAVASGDWVWPWLASRIHAFYRKFSLTMQRLDALLQAAVERGASDLHLVAGAPPAFRINGEIILADVDILTSTELEDLAGCMLNAEQAAAFRRKWELCTSLHCPEVGRVRVALYRRDGHAEFSFRFCGEEIPSREDLGLPSKLDELARRPNGLLLIAGPTGSGKTTTLNYIVDLINSERRCNIVTIEDPIEFVHRNKRAIVVQQECCRPDARPASGPHRPADRLARIFHTPMVHGALRLRKRTAMRAREAKPRQVRPIENRITLFP